MVRGSRQVAEDFTWKEMEMVKGDGMIKEGVFSHLKASGMAKSPENPSLSASFSLLGLSKQPLLR